MSIYILSEATGEEVPCTNLQIKGTSVYIFMSSVHKGDSKTKKH